MAAMVGFVGVGCGDDNNPVQTDAAAHDVAADTNVADVPVPTDVAQDDVILPQADAANTSGTVLILKAAPQHAGIPQIDVPFGSLQLSYVSAGWTSLHDQDQPTVKYDPSPGSPMGCKVYYYKRGQTNDAGVASDYLPDTANAGDVTVSGYTKGQFVLGVDDGGAPILSDTFPDTITCKHNEIALIDDAGVPTDAGVGRFEYDCDNVFMGQAAPVTAFLVPGTDKLTVAGTGGGLEISPFSASNVDVNPFIKVLPQGTLWALPTLAANSGSDAGVPLSYSCGDSDAGVDTAPCTGVIAINITWSDYDYPLAQKKDSLGSLKWNNERGKIQCAAPFTAPTGYTIPWEIWNAAFPAGATVHTIQTYVLHFSYKTSGNNTIGAGGGQIGVTWM